MKGGGEVGLMIFTIKPLLMPTLEQLFHREVKKIVMG
jgi:hypothetical protein